MSQRATSRVARTAVAVAACGLVLTGCNALDDGSVQPEVIEPAGLAPDPEQLFGDPENYDGISVEIEGAVAEVIGQGAFAVEGPPGTSYAPLLVLHDGTATVDEGTSVQVSGVVDASLDIAAVESELGVALDDGLLADNVGKAYVRASALTTSP